MPEMKQTPSPVRKNGKKKPSPFDVPGFPGLVWTILHDVTCFVVLAMVLCVFVIRLVTVQGSSMYPTLVGSGSGKSTGDLLLLESSFLCGEYQPGDIVVACIPEFENGKPIVKRVIAAGGQTISFRQEGTEGLRVYVDGERLEEPYITWSGPMQARGNAVDGYSLQVPEGCYFLMGDNRNNSSDSRYNQIGPVDGRCIIGKVYLVLTPGADGMAHNSRDWSRVGDVYGD